MTAHKTPTVGDVLRAREAAGRLLRLWIGHDDHWIGEDEDRSLWTWPAEDDGWSMRRPCASAQTGALTEAHPSMATGTGWPGVREIERSLH